MKPYRVPRLVLLLALVFTACSNPTVTTPREMTADSNGLALHVRVAGDPAAGNVLIAIHGGPGMTSDYMLSLEELAGYDLTADLAGLSQRVLNLWGDDDPCRPIASPAILAALTHAEVETVALSRCGHFWHECPEQFFAAMRAFLDRAAAAK